MVTKHRTSEGRPAIEVAKENGVSQDAFFSRIHRGISVDDAAKTPAMEQGNIKYRMPDGRLGLDVARENGVSKSAYHARISKGWSIEDAAKTSRPFGVTTHPLYCTWAGIKARTTNPNNRYWSSYGGAGVTMDPEWLQSSKSFLSWIDENLGPRPEGCTLDRINVKGNYEPGNLRWANGLTQASNQKRHLAAVAVISIEKLIEEALSSGRMIHPKELQSILNEQTFSQVRTKLLG